MPVYRYQLTLFDPAAAAKQVPGVLVEGANAPPIYKDITAPSGSKADLDDYMSKRGFTFLSTDPPTTPAQDQAAADFSVHTNIAGEIAGVALKGVPVNADLLLIEDSAAGNAKKSVTIGSLPSSGGSVSSVFGRTGAVVAASNDYSAAQVSFAPNGNIAATTVQAAVVEVRDESVQDGDAASGDLTGTYPGPTVANLAITDAKVATANKDGTAGTPSMRTLGAGATQATAGNDSRLSDARTPTGAAGGQLGGTYPNPDVRGIRETAGPTSLTFGAIADGQLLKRSGATVIGVSASFDIRDLLVFDHFLGNNISSAQSTDGTANWIVSATGTGNSQAVTGEAGHPGIFRLVNGTTATSRSAIHLGDTTFRNIIAGGSNPLVYECLISPRTSVASANLLRLQMGLGSGWALANPNPLTDGIYFRLEPGLSGNIFGVVANASVRTTVDLGVAAVVGNWYRLGFTFTPGGTPQVQFTLNGANVGSPVTTNIPTALLGLGFRTDANAGTACDVFVDYVSITQVTNKET